jgi:ankyrin repeat protein
MSDLFKLVQKAKTDEGLSKATKVIKQYIAENKSLLITGDDQNNLMHQAAKYAPDLIPLLSSVIDVNSRNKNAAAPLHTAAKYNKDSVKQLLKHDELEINVLDAQNNTPLHYAAKFNQGTVKLLIKKGADANAKNTDGKTPLDLLQIAEHKSESKSESKSEHKSESKKKTK